MSPVFRAGLVLPSILAAATAIAWLALDIRWAFGLLAAGALAIVVFHLSQLDSLLRWAAGPVDSPVPEGVGDWRITFSALYRRVRTRTAFERDLERTIERFRNAAEAIPDGIVLLDVRNRIRWANARAQSQFGVDLAQDVGRPLSNLVRQPEIVRYLHSADFNQPVVVESQRASGVTLSIQVFPFGIDEKLLISRDITDLEAVARMRRDFIANVSHELKTPLTVITGFVETLLDLPLDARQRHRYLELVEEQTKSMEHLVSDLLTLSSLESEQNALAEASFPIEPLLQQVLIDARALSSGQHTIELESIEPSMVVGSRHELASAFGNLASNAIHYTPAGGAIMLGWQRSDDGGALFSVTDTGIGIAPEHVPRLTERFYRVDRSRSRATGGTGLGLAIVKHVLLRHQASLDVRTTPGHGSTFAVHLPPERVKWLPSLPLDSETSDQSPAPTLVPSNDT